MISDNTKPNQFDKVFWYCPYIPKFFSERFEAKEYKRLHIKKKYGLK